jgi:hypothetical protein
VQSAALRLHQPSDGILVACLGRLQQLALRSRGPRHRRTRRRASRGLARASPGRPACAMPTCVACSMASGIESGRGRHAGDRSGRFHHDPPGCSRSKRVFGCMSVRTPERRARTDRPISESMAVGATTDPVAVRLLVWLDLEFMWPLAIGRSAAEIAALSAGIRREHRQSSRAAWSEALRKACGALAGTLTVWPARAIDVAPSEGGVRSRLRER